MLNVLVFPNHLFASLAREPEGTVFNFVESEEFFRRFTFSKQKLTFYRAAMQAMRERLLTKGYVVHYYDCVQYPTLTSVFQKWSEVGIKTVHHFTVTDYAVQKELEKESYRHGIILLEKNSAQFLLANKEVNSLPSANTLYENVRKKYTFLIKGKNEPEGGSWLLSAQKSKDKNISFQPEMESNRYIDEAVEYVEKYFPKNPRLTQALLYPVTHNDARDWVLEYCETTLPQFGYEYEKVRENTLFGVHSGTALLLNTGLLLPQEVCETIIAYCHKKKLPAAVAENFIRRIARDREYLWHAYRLQPQKLSLASPLPQKVSRAKTGVEPIDSLVKKLYQTGYLSHPERIFLSEFFLLCNITREQISQFFLKHLLDAAGWAIIPSVKNMKPKLTASSYIKRGVKSGEWMQVWDSLLANSKDSQKSSKTVKQFLNSLN